MLGPAYRHLTLNVTMHGKWDTKFTEHGEVGCLINVEIQKFNKICNVYHEYKIETAVRKTFACFRRARVSFLQFIMRIFETDALLRHAISKNVAVCM